MFPIMFFGILDNFQLFKQYSKKFNYYITQKTQCNALAWILTFIIQVVRTNFPVRLSSMMFLKFDINHQLIKKSNEIRLLVLHTQVTICQIICRQYHVTTMVTDVNCSLSMAVVVPWWKIKYISKRIESVIFAFCVDRFFINQCRWYSFRNL